MAVNTDGSVPADYMGCENAHSFLKVIVNIRAIHFNYPVAAPIVTTIHSSNAKETSHDCTDTDLPGTGSLRIDWISDCVGRPERRHAQVPQAGRLNQAAKPFSYPPGKTLGATLAPFFLRGAAAPRCEE